MGVLQKKTKKQRTGWRVSVVLLMYLLLLGVLALWNGGVCRAASSGVVAQIRGKGANVNSVLYNGSNGLPTSEANDILQTSNGIIWIGSYSGLIRYDGNDFYRYSSTQGISSVVCLFEDSKGRLWIGTNDSGVALYENGEFKMYNQEDGLRSLSIRAIQEDADGNILIATTMGLACVDEDGTFHMINEAQLNEEYICRLRSGADGLTYGVTLNGAIFTIGDRKLSGYYNGLGLGNRAVNCITPDPDHPGYVYLGLDNSDILYGSLSDGLKSYETYSAAPQSMINMVCPMDDLIWVCADNGIGYFDAEGNYTAIQDVPMNNSVDVMLRDYEGNLWFASSRQGVMKMSVSHFTDLNKAAGLEPMVVNATCMYEKELYVGTDKGLYILDQDYEPRENDLTELLSGIRIRCILKDSQNRLWLCTYSDNGLICYHANGEYECFNEENGMSSNRVRTVKELSDGSILVSCSGGVHLIRDGVYEKCYNGQNGINNTEILSLEEGEGGVLYFGSDGNGIYKIDGNEVTHFGLEDGLSSEVVMRIRRDPVRDMFWIITSNSLAYMIGDQISTITKFPYSNNFDILFDGDNGAWVLSSNGIYVTNVDSLIGDQEPAYMMFDTKCGLPCVATANSFSDMDADGNLYIAGTTGVSLINVRDIDEDTQEIKLTVPYIEVDGKLMTVKDGQKVTLPSDARRVTIYGYALTYSLKNPRVSYYLEGFEDSPVYCSKLDMDPVDYTNLESGKYVFHMAVIDTLTGEEANSIRVVIEKQRAVYEYLWFKALMAALGVVLILVCVQIYMRRKTAAFLKKQKEDEIIIEQIIQAFAKCIDMKDRYTNGHSFRVAKYSQMLAEKMGMSEQEVKNIHNVALLHDIGKISISDNILNKDSRLTDEEFKQIQQHAQNGYEILKDIQLVPDIAIGAGYHHEHLDGSGYPRGLTGEQIPLTAQIIAVADTFDAMYSTRPYRKQLPIEVVLGELRRVSGTQLNGEVVECLAALVDEGKIGGEVL